MIGAGLSFSFYCPSFSWSSNRYTTSLAFHKTLHSLESYRSPAENELHLTYLLSSPSSPTKHCITIALLFHPNTRQLASADISGLPDGGSTDDLIGAYQQANDAPGLIAATLARARAHLR